MVVVALLCLVVLSYFCAYQLLYIYNRRCGILEARLKWYSLLILTIS